MNSILEINGLQDVIEWDLRNLTLSDSRDKEVIKIENKVNGKSRCPNVLHSEF
jgi:hypothetical protein